MPPTMASAAACPVASLMCPPSSLACMSHKSHKCKVETMLLSHLLRQRELAPSGKQPLPASLSQFFSSETHTRRRVQPVLVLSSDVMDFANRSMNHPPAVRIRGMVHGRAAIVIEHIARLREDLRPDWAQPAQGGGSYRVEITGEPSYARPLPVEPKRRPQPRGHRGGRREDRQRDPVGGGRTARNTDGAGSAAGDRKRLVRLEVTDRYPKKPTVGSAARSTTRTSLALTNSLMPNGPSSRP
jgi:hypothetical protein